MGKTMINQDTIKFRSVKIRQRVDLLTIAAYGVLILLIGGNFVAVRFSSFGLPPFWGAGIRFLAASLLLFLYVAMRRHPLPKGRALAGLCCSVFCSTACFTPWLTSPWWK